MFLAKRKNGIFYIVYTKPNGNRSVKSTNTTDEVIAEKILKVFQEQYLDEQISKVIPITLNEYRMKFLRYSESIHTWKTTKAFASTLKAFTNYFGNIKLTEVNSRLAEDYLQMRINKHSVYVARKDHINLSSMFTKALRDGYVRNNPFKGIKRLRIPERLPVFYSDDDLLKLTNSIDNETVKAITLFAVNTGLRQAEITSLQWNQINLQKKLFILDNRSHITKSKRIRTIPLNDIALQILNERLINEKSSFVFTLNKKPIKPDTLSKQFKLYVRKAKISEDLTFHSLRHTFASRLVQKGVSIYIVSKLLGHSDIKTTMIYSHLRTDDLKNAVDKLDG